MKELNDVLRFHKSFNIPIKDSVGIPSKDRCVLREDLMQEEMNELIEAIHQRDINQVAKEAADVLYVLLGTIAEFGLHERFQEIFNEVHLSNMSKLTKDGRVLLREDGKVMKSDQYKPADIAALMKRPKSDAFLNSVNGKMLPAPKMILESLGEKQTFVRDTICNHFGVTWEALQSKNRNAKLVKARHFYIYCCVIKLDIKNTVIGKELNRDHTSAIHAREKMRYLIKNRKDEEFVPLLRFIENHLSKYKVPMNALLSSLSQNGQHITTNAND